MTMLEKFQDMQLSPSFWPLLGLEAFWPDAC